MNGSENSKEKIMDFYGIKLTIGLYFWKIVYLILNLRSSHIKWRYDIWKI